MNQLVADVPLTQEMIDAHERWGCAWCGKVCDHKPKPGTFGVVCAECAANGPPNAGAFED
jgi:hypothetical protein